MMDYMLNFDMHGYGVYVWSAYGLVFSAMIVNFVTIRNREKHLKKILKEKVSSI